MSFNSILTRILVCDTNPLLADALCTALSQRGPFTTRVSGGDLVASAQVFRPNVVVVDPGNLPTTPDVLRTELTKHLPQCEVLAYVKVGDNAAALRCLAAGFAGVISLGRNIEVLVEAVTVVRLGGIYIDQGFVLTTARSRNDLAAAVDQALGPLSPRERYVLEQVARGLSTKEIAVPLGLSPKTVETHRARASAKLGLRRKSEIVQYALRHGWLADQLRAA